MLNYFIIYKPFNTLSQFSPQEGKLTLKDYFEVPGDLYPVGRLDYDSEGLLILTNDKSLNQRLLHPRYEHEREYWVQVEGSVGPEAIGQLQKGVLISVDGRPYQTRPCQAALLSPLPPIPERNPPIRHRARIPTSWLRLILTEGKNRQVRKMTATGFPTLRLIRSRIEKIGLDDLQPGEMREIAKGEIFGEL